MERGVTEMRRGRGGGGVMEMGRDRKGQQMRRGHTDELGLIR